VMVVKYCCAKWHTWNVIVVVAVVACFICCLTSPQSTHHSTPFPPLSPPLSFHPHSPRPQNTISVMSTHCCEWE
jgi:hypothetical protein